MNESPKALRLHIGLFGRRNAGKSSLLNALVGQDVAIVSPTPGSTADPVEKTLEMAPLGPVVFLYTAGLDDRDASLGAQRVERSLRAMRRVDVALLVLDAPCWEAVDADTAARLAAAGIPFAVVVNSRGTADTCDAAWRPDGLAATVPVLWASAREGWGLEGIRAALARLAPAGALKQPPLVHDLLPEHGTLLLVVPLDSGAPQGRLILPQVQTIRDSLDGRCLCLVVTEEQLPQAFAALREPPDLVVCDSQVVHVAARLTPPSVPLTTFSILMARAKGDLVELARGAAALTRLRPGQTVLVQEACSHHAQKDDIGRVKIPRLLARLAGGPVETPMLAGKEFTEYAGDAAAVVHCGACAITRGQMLARLDEARAHGLPMTNYGMCISLAQGVLERVLSPFPEALAAWRAEAQLPG